VVQREWELTRVQLSLAFESFCFVRGNATLVLIDRGMRVKKTLMQILASQLSSTLMQLLFSFDRGMRVKKTLMQTLASQLSSTHMHASPHQLPDYCFPAVTCEESLTVANTAAFL
jgi:hypothetical protein